MRILNELEMSVAAGGVDPIPVPFEPPCMPQPDPTWVRLIMELMVPQTVNIPDQY